MPELLGITSPVLRSLLVRWKYSARSGSSHVGWRLAEMLAQAIGYHHDLLQDTSKSEGIMRKSWMCVRFVDLSRRHPLI